MYPWQTSAVEWFHASPTLESVCLLKSWVLSNSPSLSAPLDDVRQALVLAHLHVHVLGQGKCCRIHLYHSQAAVTVAQITCHVPGTRSRYIPLGISVESGMMHAITDLHDFAPYQAHLSVWNVPINPISRFHLPAHHRQMVWMTSLLKSRAVDHGKIV